MALSFSQVAATFSKPSKRDDEGGLGGNWYPFWNMKTGEQAVIRFLPDGNPDNPLGFLIEKLTHTLHVGEQRHVVPCSKMHGIKCPICEVSSKFYNAKDEVNGKKYWRKKQHIAQALVIEDPLPPNEESGETHQGKVRYVSIAWQLFSVITDAFKSGDLEDFPYAFKGGTNFVIKKSEQGKYASYQFSKFAKKASDLPDDVVANLELVDLATLLPAAPTEAEVERIRSLLEQSLDPSLIVQGESDGPAVERESVPEPVAAVKAPVAAKVEAPKAATDATTSATAAAILAKIKARQSGG